MPFLNSNNICKLNSESFDDGRSSIDPVILVNILLIQRLFGIKSMR